jgi:hypothetical protein
MHRTAFVAQHDSDSDEITFSTLKVAGLFRGEYLIIEGDELKTISSIDSPATNRALRLMWQGERVTDTHRQELETELLCRTEFIA